MATGIELHALRAMHGDSFILSYIGADNERSYIIIDGGPKPAFKESLQPWIAATLKTRGSLPVRLCLLTHVDDDHIGGLLKLFDFIDKNPNKISIVEVWMNAFPTEDRLDPVGSDSKVLLESIKQGNELHGKVRALNIPINWSTAMSLGRDGIEATVVAPDAKALEKLEASWVVKSSEALLADYDDKSPTNLSSIVVLFEKKSVKLLMCGDARGDKIIEGLEKKGKLKKGGTLSLDLLKVPHHGGAHNTTAAFFQRLPADKYLISTDGNKFDHPHHTTLSNIFAARKADFPDEPFEILLTYDLDELGTKPQKTGKPNDKQERADMPAIRAAIAKARADGLKFTVEKVTSPLTF